MTDEIDLLRRFREDLPGPGQAAWDRAQAAVAEARAGGRKARRRRWRLPSRRVSFALGVAIIGAVTAVLIAGVLQGPPALTSPVTTAWQQARPLPAAGNGVPASAAGWRLTSYLVSRGWQENTAGPEPGVLTCPTASTCYVEGDSATSSSGPADMNSLYVSTDAARSWSVLPVPAGVTFTSPLACLTATNCTAGGLYYGSQPVYLTTASGGHSWTVRPLPAGVGQVMNLDCVSVTTCRGLASVSGKALSPGFSFMADMQFVVTSDGGRHFTVAPFPKGESVQSVSCPTAYHCVAVGVYDKLDSGMAPNLDHGVLLTSDDGGLRWRQRDWPADFGPGPTPEVTCTDARHCAMIGFVEHNGTVTDQLGGVTSGRDAVQYNVIGFSADGGATWTTSTFPRTIPYPSIDVLTCTTNETCFAAGGDLIAQRIGNAYNAQSAMVAITNDAGRTWQRVSFAVPASVPGGMQGDSFMDIGQIECPDAHACTAIGVSDQGSTSTPIYTYNGHS
jgi:hypothetical protein